MVNGLVFPAGGELRVEGRPTTRMGPDPPAPPHRLRDPGGRPVPALHRGAKTSGWCRASKAGCPRDIDARVAELLEQRGPAAGPLRRALPAPAFRRASASASAWRARSPPIRRCCSSTSLSAPLDPVTRLELQRQFLALRRTLGKTALFVTHDVREALLVGNAHRRCCATAAWRCSRRRRNSARSAEPRSPRLSRRPGLEPGG